MKTDYVTDFRSIAIVPAAGRSRRMGRPKLLLEFNGKPLIDVVLRAWTESQVDQVVVVVRPDDEALAARCRTFPVDVAIPRAAPPTMRASIECGLDFAANTCQIRGRDAWLVSPADIPGLESAVIDRLLSIYSADEPSILVPTVDSLRAHPALLPWQYESQLRQLPPEEGLNALIRRSALREVPCDVRELLQDVDTPEAFLALSDEA